MRSVGLNLTMCIFYGLGMICASWQAVWLGSWRSFMVWTALPQLLVTGFYFLIQESAQWLVTRQDFDGAELRLRRVAKFNRRDVSEADYELFRQHCKTKESEARSQMSMQKQARLIDSFKLPRLRLRLIYVTVVL